MANKKTSKATLKELNEKKQIKEMEARLNFTAGNAEKAFVLLDEMRIESSEKSLFDIVFGGTEDEVESALNMDVYDNMTEAQRKDFIKLQEKVSKAVESKDIKEVAALQSELTTKFPTLINMSKATKISQQQKKREFWINKILKLSGERTWELAKLYTQDKIDNFLEAVEQAKLYIMFLS